MALAGILRGSCRTLPDQRESPCLSLLRQFDPPSSYLGARIVRRRRVTSLDSTRLFSSSSSERNCSYSRSRTIRVETWAMYPNMVAHLCCTLGLLAILLFWEAMCSREAKVSRTSLRAKLFSSTTFVAGSRRSSEKIFSVCFESSLISVPPSI